MDRFLGKATDNIRNIARLSQFPNRQLRVEHAHSCLPEILYESRTFAPMVRMLTGDSRRTVLEALERTIDFVLDISKISNVHFIREIKELDAGFRSGLEAFRMHYESDMYVAMVYERIVARWSSLVENGHPNEDV